MIPTYFRIQFLLCLVHFATWANVELTGSSGENVLVVFNSAIPESAHVADYYASKRKVPALHMLGLDLSRDESLSREDFKTQLRDPILRHLEKNRLIHFVTNSAIATNQVTNSWVVGHSPKIRYIVLTYGVPLKIRESTLEESMVENVVPQLRKTESAVDNELALLPLIHLNLTLSGPIKNPLYTATNNLMIQASNGIYMVARLDAPTPRLARGLVDKALQAEKEGLWGRAYFDLRDAHDDYKTGDDWLIRAADHAARYGFDTIIDRKPETFPQYFPMSHIALYFGWYDTKVSGPFLAGTVDFQPGAIAYHLFSFSASTVREPGGSWVSTFIEKGATATLGSVWEPYLAGTPDLSIFTARLLGGFTFGEASYASMSSLSWQTTVIGDPLYRPFGKQGSSLHEYLKKAQSPMLEWSHCRVVNLNLKMNAPLRELAAYLENEPLTRKSAVLMEKLAAIYEAQGKPDSSIHAMVQVLKLKPSLNQEIRIALQLAHKYEEQRRYADAFDLYKKFKRLNPTYGDMETIFNHQLALAGKLNLTSDIPKIQKEREQWLRKNTARN